MKILWLTNIILPDAARYLGLKENPYGSWMSSLLMVLKQNYPDNEYCILTASDDDIVKTIGGIQYRTYKGSQFAIFKKGIPIKIEDRIINHIKDFCPDIIHIHGTENYYSLIRPNRIDNIPIIISLQGIINGCSPFFSGGLSQYDLMPHKNWIRRIIKNDGIMNSQRIWQTQKSDQERRAISQNKYFIGRTKWDYAWTKALNSNASYFHIDEIMRPNFYNTVRDKLKIRTHSIYCSSASNYPLKGLHWLLIAIAFLLPKYPDIELRIADAESCLNEPNTIISFIKDQEYAKYLRKMIKKLGLINHIIALPKLNAAAVEEELKKTHIFCLPSLCENSPNSLAEAMLMEVPSIATFVGGIPDLIIDGYDGILCSPSDPIRLAEKIDILFSSDEISQNIAHNARIVAIDRHNKNRIASEIIKVYKSIIKDNTK